MIDEDNSRTTMRPTVMLMACCVINQNRKDDKISAGFRVRKNITIDLLCVKKFLLVLPCSKRSRLSQMILDRFRPAYTYDYRRFLSETSV